MSRLGEDAPEVGDMPDPTFGRRRLTRPARGVRDARGTEAAAQVDETGREPSSVGGGSSSAEGPVGRRASTGTQTDASWSVVHDIGVTNREVQAGAEVRDGSGGMSPMTEESDPWLADDPWSHAAWETRRGHAPEGVHGSYHGNNYNANWSVRSEASGDYSDWSWRDGWHTYESGARRADDEWSSGRSSWSSGSRRDWHDQVHAMSWENYSWRGGQERRSGQDERSLEGDRQSRGHQRDTAELYATEDDDVDFYADGNQEVPELASPMSPQSKVVKDGGNKPTGAVPSGVPSVAGNSASNGTTGGKVSTSYPPIFYARPGESWDDYWRSVTFWVASEGKSLPAEMRGPRLMQQLRERAGKIVQHLSVDKVSGPDGIDIIRREMEKSPIIKILDNRKVDKRRQKFMKLGRLPSESIESFLNRAEIYRRENDTSPEYHVGSKFYVGHLLDAAKLTKRDLALIKASTGGTLEDEDKVTTALLELADQLEGAPGCYIGKGETTLDQEDKYLVQKPTSSSTTTPSSSASSTASGYRRRFRGGFRGGRKLRDTLMAILEDECDEDDEDGASGQPEGVGEESCDEVAEEQPGVVCEGRSEADAPDMLAEIYAQEFKARNRVREIKKMMQYYQAGQQGGAGGRRREQDPHVKKWVEERQKTDPCFLCGKLGHWSEECPLRKKNGGPQAGGAGQSQVYHTNVTFAASRNSTQDWEFLERYAADSHQYKGALDVELIFEAHTSDVTPVHDTLWSMQELGNKMIVDLGCMKTVAGTTWIKTLLERLTSLGRYFRVVRESEKFRFGDGRVLQSQYHVVAEVSLATLHCVLRISVVPGNCPPLLSKVACTSLGFVLDTDQHTVSSKRFRVPPFGLDHTGHGYKQGHYLLSVDDFLPDMLPLESFQLPPHVEVQPLSRPQSQVGNGASFHRGRGDDSASFPAGLREGMGDGRPVRRGDPGGFRGRGRADGGEQHPEDEEEAFIADQQVQAEDGSDQTASGGDATREDGRDGLRVGAADDAGDAGGRRLSGEAVRVEQGQAEREAFIEQAGGRAQGEQEGCPDRIPGRLPDAQQPVLHGRHVQHHPELVRADDHLQVEAPTDAHAGQEHGGDGLARAPVEAESTVDHESARATPGQPLGARRISKTTMLEPQGLWIGRGRGAGDRDPAQPAVKRGDGDTAESTVSLYREEDRLELVAGPGLNYEVHAVQLNRGQTQAVQKGLSRMRTMLGLWNEVC